MSGSSNGQRCGGPSRREILRVGSLGFLGLGLDEWFRLRLGRAGSGSSAEGQELHLDLAGRRPVAPGHLRPEARRGGGRPGRVQADRDLGPGPADQRGPAEPGQGHEPRDPDPEHDLARVRPRPGVPPPADRLSPVAGPGISGVRQRRRQGAGGQAGNAPALCRGPRRPDLRPERIPDPGLRPVRRLRRPEPGGLPGPEPDPARQVDPGPADAAPRYGQVARRLLPRRPGDLADDQPRPVLRAGVLPADLQRGPGGVPDRTRSPTRSGKIRADDLRPIVPAGASAGRGGRLVRDAQRPRHRPARLGHARPELSRRSRTRWHRRWTRGSRRCSRTSPSEASSTTRWSS